MSINTCSQVAPAEAARSLLQAFQSRSSAQNITLHTTKKGLVFTREKQPIAWVVCGYHNGQHENLLKTCRFVDVAYFRKTQKGENLETADFLDLSSALHFVADTFGFGGEV